MSFEIFSIPQSWVWQEAESWVWQEAVEAPAALEWQRRASSPMELRLALSPGASELVEAPMAAWGVQRALALVFVRSYRITERALNAEIARIRLRQAFLERRWKGLGLEPGNSCSECSNTCKMQVPIALQPKCLEFLTDFLHFKTC